LLGEHANFFPYYAKLFFGHPVYFLCKIWISKKCWNFSLAPKVAKNLNFEKLSWSLKLTKKFTQKKRK
jgi:hypothetical protein